VTSTTTPVRPGRAARRVPAEPEFWIFVFGDLSVFTAFFFVWAVTQRHHEAVFAAGHATLNQPIGVLNTALLLASSAAVATAVRAVRASQGVIARRAYLLAVGLGGGFLVGKAVEYTLHFTHGLESLRGPFFTDYFVFTGVHALHVFVGLVCLLVARAKARNSDPVSGLMIHEAVATYWHMIDVVWVVLFSLIYLT